MSDYFKIPRSLELDPKWIAYSLKRRAFFLFLVSRAVFSESKNYKGINLTYGQYLTSQRKIADEFNLTVKETEDKIDKSFVHRALKKMIEDSFINCVEIILANQPQTLITISHLDTYNLIKYTSEPQKSFSEPHANHKEKVLANHPLEDKNIHPSNNEGQFKNLSKMLSEPQTNSFKQRDRTTQQEQQDQNNDNVYKRQCPEMLLFSKKMEDIGDDDESVIFLSRRFKLNSEQVKSFKWLKNQKIDTKDGTLCFWAKTYSLSRLQDVHKHSVKNNKEGLGKCMNHFLSKNIPVEDAYVRDNREFSIAFKGHENWSELNIGDKYVTCKVGDFIKEIPLSYSPNSFADALINIYNNFFRKVDNI